jgi:hypothetical protein
MTGKLSKDTVSITLGALLGKQYKEDRIVGAELEVESNSKLPVINSGTWNTVSDPSLRTGMAKEYVLRSPIPYKGVDTALFNLLRSLNDKELSEPIKDAPTTSWHIHLNALGLTPNQLMTRIFMYWLLEPILIKHCGTIREHNTFCLQLKDATRNTNTFDTTFFNGFISSPRNVFGAAGFNQRFRYMAQNYTALAKFGSVEYRAMRGTLEYDEIKPWTDALTKMWQFKEFRNPSELLSFFYDKGLLALFDRVINEPAFHKYYTKDMEEQAEEQALVLLHIENNNLFSWEKWEDHIRDRQYLRVLEGLDSPSPSPLRNDDFDYDDEPIRSTPRRSITSSMRLNSSIVPAPPVRTDTYVQSLLRMGYTEAQVNEMLYGSDRTPAPPVVNSTGAVTYTTISSN